jgi:GT2 family glycosyltransferase
MSLQDVEPVKSFITDMVDIRNRLASPAKEITADNFDGSIEALARTAMQESSKIIVDEMDRAFSKLHSGFGVFVDPASNDRKIRRGWKIAKADVPHPDRDVWPSVCIVIPVFNSPELLTKCLVSLWRTSYPGQVYYCCVDNASTDPETLRILADADFEPIRFDEPVGFSTAVNAGIKACPGFDYYVLFNQDCQVIDEHWLEHLINWMELRPECAIAGPKLLYPDGRIQHCGIEIPRGSCGKHRLLRMAADTPDAQYYEKVQAVTGAVYCIRATANDALGGLDEGYMFGCEDTEYCLRVAASGKEVWYVPDSVVRHIDNGIRKDNRDQSDRIRSWTAASDKKFRSEWGPFVDLCDSGHVAFVLPDWNPVAGGCRVVGALANTFITAGIETTIYTMNDRLIPGDADFPMLFDIKPIRALREADVLVATRFDTVAATQHIPARRKFYLVQQIETPMAKYCGGTEDDVLRSYAQTEYEIITIGQHLADQLAELGRTSKILDVGFYRDLYPYVPNRSGSPVKVLMYASPADYKGGEDLPKIAAAIRERLGNSVEINSFHRDFESPTWSDRHFRPKTTKELAKIYAEHDIYVYASLSDGFAMTPIEAMACGTAVILTDFPGKDQYAKQGINCLIEGFRDAEGIASAVMTLARRPEQRKQLVMAGLQTAAHYDWSVVGKQYLREMLGSPV